MLRLRLFYVLAALSVAAFTAIGATASAVGISSGPPAVAPAAVTADEEIDQIMDEEGVLRFDVSEDATRFVWSGNPELVDGMPAASTSFVTQGYIYPAGTLSDSNGVNADGSPEFPDKVLGQWSCWGWRLGPSDHTASAPWLNTHLFSFGDAAGEATLVSEGYSIDDINVAISRVVSGGTGQFAGVSGVQAETLLGFNATNGGNFSYEVTVGEQ
jgi:hypothetical protein